MGIKELVRTYFQPLVPQRIVAKVQAAEQPQGMAAAAKASSREAVEVAR
jgi:hypothetical protein